MAIEFERDTLPMRIHKNLLLRALHMSTPEEVPKMCPDYPGTPEGKAAAIKAIEEHPGEWVIGGELLTPEQWAEVAPRYGETA